MKIVEAILLAVSISGSLFAQEVDPCMQTAKLSQTAQGVRIFTDKSNGNKPLAGSPYGYEIWTEGGNNNKLLWFGPNQGGGAAFRTEWNNPNDYLGRVGLFMNQGKPYTDYKNLYADYSYIRSANGTAGGYSYVSIYGWTKNPLVEWYIVEDWFGDGILSSLGILGTYKGDFKTLDGVEYKIYKNVRPPGSGNILGDRKAFPQYFSVRQRANNSPSTPMCGSVAITEHFQKWDTFDDMKMGDDLYEAKFLIEAGGGTGWFEATYLKMTQEDRPRNSAPKQHLILNDSNYFEMRGLNLMVFSNWYDGLFDDAKISGAEIIHHGVRTVTNGDVRLNPTPGQWDAIPEFVERKIDRENRRIEAVLKYSKYDFQYTIRGEARAEGFYLSVHTDQPIPEALNGIAGLNLEFLPSAYFGKSYCMDETTGVFPLYPSDNMQMINGENEPVPLAAGKQIALAPDDPERSIFIRSSDNELMLFDGRNKAQNGWFVVRSLLPAGKSGKIAEWFITAQTIPDWTRRPVIAHSQVGYHPEQQKTAVIELDKNDKPLASIQLQKINSNGSITTILNGETKYRGDYLRYHYLTFDFSAVKEPGIYRLQYGDIVTAPFRIATDVYQNAWHPTSDVFMPVQMDHVFVREAYRVWHGASHLDDALQAPVNHRHFDLYAQGPTTGNRFKPLEHIPGLNTGGWYDAGDFDIRTQTQQSVILDLVRSWEYFDLKRDETTVNQKNRYVEMHLPDGKPDILQQIEHGVLQLLAQQKSVGYAINGIIAAHIRQYRHLGDGVTTTDNLIFNPRLDSLQSDGRTGGAFDDRWAFTNRSTPLNYGSAAALAAASRALTNYDKTLAAECLSFAKKIWKEEHSHQPDIFDYKGLNTIGGPLDMEELRAAIELLHATGEAQYKKRILEMYPEIETRFGRFAALIAQAIPLMNASFKKQVEPAVKTYMEQINSMSQMNPFGVFISTGGWAGNGGIIQTAITCYLLHKSFPELVDKEHVYKGLNYIFGCHPDSDISFVSAVGAKSKQVAYGNNRADFSFIAGGIVPGVLILKPDFPENKEDWPFFWGENEYVVNMGASYIFLVNAVNDLLNEENE